MFASATVLRVVKDWGDTGDNLMLGSAGPCRWLRRRLDRRLFTKPLPIPYQKYPRLPDCVSFIARF
jgi:hypothetical protein